MMKISPRDSRRPEISYTCFASVGCLSPLFFLTVLLYYPFWTMAAGNIGKGSNAHIVESVVYILQADLIRYYAHYTCPPDIIRYPGLAALVADFGVVCRFDVYHPAVFAATLRLLAYIALTCCRLLFLCEHVICFVLGRCFWLAPAIFYSLHVLSPRPLRPARCLSAIGQ